MVPLAWRAGARRFLPLFAILLLSPAARLATYLSLGAPADYVTYFERLRSPFHLSLDGLVVGTAIALAYSDEALWRRIATPERARALRIAGGGAALLLLAVAPLVDNVNALEAALLASAVALVFGAVVAGTLASEEGPLRALLRSRFLLFFSKISYSLYLVHMLFMEPVARALEGVPAWHALDVDARFFVYLPLYATLSIAAGTLLHYLVEKPFLQLKDRL